MNTSAFGASSRQLGTVLVVDADVVFREFEARTLSDRGYAVLKATGAEEALRLTRQNANIHLLLAGSWIHEPDTFELSQQFQTAYPDAAILLVLGAFDRFDQRFNRLGCVGVMAKPFTLNGLIDNVRQLLTESIVKRHGQRGARYFCYSNSALNTLQADASSMTHRLSPSQPADLKALD